MENAISSYAPNVYLQKEKLQVEVFGTEKKSNKRQSKLGTQLHYFSRINKVFGFFCLFIVI